MTEPKDGDFVAYVEALQRDSAARLMRQSPPRTAPPEATKDHFFEQRKKPDRRIDMQAALERFLRRDGDAMLVKPLVAAVVGMAALLVWLGRGGTFWFVVALVTLLYGIPRLARALRAFAAPPPNRAAIDQVFGKGGKG